MFINATAHPLTPVQIEAVKNHGWGEIINLNYSNAILHARLCNCPLTIDELEVLAHDLTSELALLVSNHPGETCTVHMPIGSPAFMWVFARMNSGFSGFVFSHSERKSVEKEVNGTIQKTSEFVFIKFVEA